MTDREFEEYLSRDVEKRKWSEGALERVRALNQAKRDLEKALAERDKALQARDKALADIEARAKRDATAADKERVALAAELKDMRDAVEAAVEKKRAELKGLQDRIDQTLIAVTKAEERREQVVAKNNAEADASAARRDAMLAEEQAVKGRLAALIR